MVFQQWVDDAQPVHQRPHPLQNLALLLGRERLHGVERLLEEAGLVGRAAEVVDAPSVGTEHSLEVVGGYGGPLQAVDVVGLNSNMYRRAPGLVARCSACAYLVWMTPSLRKT